MKIEELFIKDIAEDGIDIPLGVPGVEEASASIRIRSVDSDTYRNARAKANRKHLRELAQLKQDEMEKKLSAENIEEAKDRISREITLDMLVSLVVSWTFETPCTPENVRRLFVNCPQVADTIDGYSHDRQLFFDRKRSGSSSGSATKSNSPKRSKARKAASANT